LIGAARLRRRVGALARRIGRVYRGRELVVVGVLKGAYVFMADLCRRLPTAVRNDFLRVQSYRDGTESSGAIRVEFDLTQPIRGRDVLLVEDIVDTGLTARALLRFLRARRPRSLRLCALLSKPSRRRVRVPIDFLGFRIPNRFVVGYGLDYRGLWRNLPYLAWITPDVSGRRPKTP
jgi:hypoxanthine phosphoribosyltransferase